MSSVAFVFCENSPRDQRKSHDELHDEVEIRPESSAGAEKTRYWKERQHRYSFAPLRYLWFLNSRRTPLSEYRLHQRPPHLAFGAPLQPSLAAQLCNRSGLAQLLHGLQAFPS